MIPFLIGAFGALAALAAHDLAAQSLNDKSFRIFSGTCPRCGTSRGWGFRACLKCARPLRRELGIVVVSVAGAFGFANTLGASAVIPAYAVFIVVSLALALTDVDAMRIVDRINLRGTMVLAVLLGAGAIVESHLDSFWRSLLGALAYFLGTNLMFFLVRGRGFGYGDVKLSVQLGMFTAFISWGTLGWAAIITALIGGMVSIGIIAVGVVRHIVRRRTAETDAPSMRDVMRTEVPYGPAMIIGAWAAIFLAGIEAFPIPI